MLLGDIILTIYIYYIFLLSSLPKCELWMVAVLSVEPTTQRGGWWGGFFRVGGFGREGGKWETI